MSLTSVHPRHSSSSPTATATATAAKPTASIAPFLRTLRRMLATESTSVLRWTPDGLAIELLDLVRMATHVLPKYFKHANYSSFQRQLNYFNFRKHARQKTHVCTFSNPYFQRDAPQLASQIVRKKATARKSSSTTVAMAATAKMPAMARPAITMAVSRPHYKDTADGYSSPTDVAFGPVSSYYHQQLQQQQQMCQLTPIPFPFACSPTNGRYTPVPVPQPPPLSLSMVAMPPSSAAKEPAASTTPSSSFAWLDAIYASLDAASASGDYYH